MKHLERAKRLLKLKEEAAKSFRMFSRLWNPGGMCNSVAAETRAEKNRLWAEDAEFEADLLREYITKWEKAGD